MGHLPDIHNGKLLQVEEDDEKGMEAIIELLPVIKQVHVKRLVRNQGWTLRKALENAGVMVCERDTRPNRPYKYEPPKEEKEI